MNLTCIIPGMKGWFDIQKSIYIINHVYIWIDIVKPLIKFNTNSLKKIVNYQQHKTLY